jgi:hypothetical protein
VVVEARGRIETHGVEIQRNIPLRRSPLPSGGAGGGGGRIPLRQSPTPPSHKIGGGSRSKRPPRRSLTPPSDKGGGGSGSKEPRHTPVPDEYMYTYGEDYVGPRCFRTHIREANTPRGFSFRLPCSLKVYDDREKPSTWLEDFYGAVTFASETPNLACRMLQLYLTGSARQWLADLLERSIHNWFDHKEAFNQ